MELLRLATFVCLVYIHEENFPGKMRMRGQGWTRRSAHALSWQRLRDRPQALPERPRSGTRIVGSSGFGHRIIRVLVNGLGQRTTGIEIRPKPCSAFAPHVVLTPVRRGCTFVLF